MATNVVRWQSIPPGCGCVVDLTYEDGHEIERTIVVPCRRHLRAHGEDVTNEARRINFAIERARAAMPEPVRHLVTASVTQGGDVVVDVPVDVPGLAGDVEAIGQQWAGRATLRVRPPD